MFLQPYQAVCLFKTEIRWTNGINMQDMYIHEVDFLIVNFPLQDNDDEIFIIELYIQHTKVSCQFNDKEPLHT